MQSVPRSSHRISEVVVCDDGSDDLSVLDALEATMTRKFPTAKLLKHKDRLRVGGNKARAVANCSSDWVVLLDSDNRLLPRYLDALFKLPTWNSDTIYCPEWAIPTRTFDFRKFSGKTFRAAEAKALIDDDSFATLLNIGNYVVNKKSYLDVFAQRDPSLGKYGDTIYFNFLWLKAGGAFHVVPGMRYWHLLHPGGHWLSNAKESSEAFAAGRAMIRGM